MPLITLQPDLDAAVNDPALGMHINLAEGRHLVRWENDLAEASLTSIGDVLGIDKETVLSEGLFAKNSHHPKRSGSKAVSQKLTARVISFEAGFKAPLFLKE